MSEQLTNDQRRAAARRAVGAGAGILVVSIGVMLLPLLWARSSLNRYFAVVGVLGVCCGAGCMLQGAIDWIRGRKR